MGRFDRKRFTTGALVGAILPWVPLMLASDGFAKLLNYIPDWLISLMKLTPTDGFGKFILVGTPTLFSVLFYSIAIGLVLALWKR